MSFGCLLTCCKSIFNYLPFAQNSNMMNSRHEIAHVCVCVCEGNVLFIYSLLPTKSLTIWKFGEVFSFHSNNKMASIEFTAVTPNENANKFCEFKFRDNPPTKLCVVNVICYCIHIFLFVSIISANRKYKIGAPWIKQRSFYEQQINC